MYCGKPRTHLGSDGFSKSAPPKNKKKLRWIPSAIYKQATPLGFWPFAGWAIGEGSRVYISLSQKSLSKMWVMKRTSVHGQEGENNSRRITTLEKPVVEGCQASLRDAKPSSIAC